MPAGLRRHPSLVRVFLTIAALVALVGQLGIVVGTLAEGRDGQGMRAHVEQAGTSIHYAHGDLCGLCQARTAQSVASLPQCMPPAPRVCTPPTAQADIRAIVIDLFAPNPSRAPPLS